MFECKSVAVIFWLNCVIKKSRRKYILKQQCGYVVVCVNYRKISRMKLVIIFSN